MALAGDGTSRLLGQRAAFNASDGVEKSPPPVAHVSGFQRKLKAWSAGGYRCYFFAAFCGTKVSVPALMPFQAGADAAVRYQSVVNCPLE